MTAPMYQVEFIRRFRELMDRKAKLVEAKNHDYAGKDDAWANFRLVEIITNGRLTASDAMLVRLSDKFRRIASLLREPGRVLDEKITDTIMDAANYFDLWLLLLEWEAENNPEVS